jgi:hypothetical protein
MQEEHSVLPASFNVANTNSIPHFLSVSIILFTPEDNYVITEQYTQYAMRTQIAIPVILLNTQSVQALTSMAEAIDHWQ